MTIQVYSKYNCPQCVKAKAILKNLNMSYDEINIEEDVSARDFLVSNGLRSLPQIFIDGKAVIGGEAVTPAALAAYR